MVESYRSRVAEPSANGQDYVIGFEYQITDDSKNGDALGERKHTAGALYDMVAPVSSNPPGLWRLQFFPGSWCAATMWSSG